MDHVAIMKKSWGLLPKILSGKKTIESRWYMNKAAPWGKILAGETIYFKNSGEPVTARARVAGVKQFENLNANKIREILEKYGVQDGLGIEEADKYYGLFRNKKYCILVFLEKPELIKPFEINKTGFGAMAAWMCVKNIEVLRARS